MANVGIVVLLKSPAAGYKAGTRLGYRDEAGARTALGDDAQFEVVGHVDGTPIDASAPAPDKSISKMNKAELLAYAAGTHQLDLDESLTVAAIRQSIADAEDAAAAGGDADGDPGDAE